MSQGFCTLATLTPLPEGQLLANAKAGDDDALEELIRQSWVPCMRVARSLLRSSDDAADVLQAAFCRAFRHLNEFRGQAQFSTWVVRIVINQCMMHLRSPDRTRVLSYDHTPGGLERLVADDPSHDNNPEENCARRQVAHVVRSELSCLPAFLRAPLEIYYLEGLELEDVAVKLGTTVTAVKSRLHRGRQYLRDRMMRHCGESGGGTLLTRQ
jgi:RNA polymerase sigma-70 factor (ECF subfamily)